MYANVGWDSVRKLHTPFQFWALALPARVVNRGASPPSRPGPRPLCPASCCLLARGCSWQRKGHEPSVEAAACPTALGTKEAEPHRLPRGLGQATAC